MYKIKGSLVAPPSKSASQRALACALIAQGESIIYNFGFSDDEEAALHILVSAGCIVSKENNTLTIKPPTELKEKYQIHCGESGLATRLFTPIFMSFSSYCEIHGKGTLLKRPLHVFKDIFHQLNIDFQWNEGKLPLQFIGKQCEQDIEIDASLSSQFVSGMIFYQLLCAKQHSTTLILRNPTSLPYIHLTIEILKHFGANVLFNNDTISLPPRQKLKGRTYTVEGDWSSAAFMMVAAAIWGEVTIKGLTLDSTQADRAILEVLRDFGAEIVCSTTSIYIKRHQFNAFHFDATQCPDLVPVVSVLACFAEGLCTIQGMHRLVHKESHRAQAIVTELSKLHIDIEIIKDTLQIRSTIDPTKIILNKSTIELDSYSDHRLAMAWHILALDLMKYVKINQPEVVSKSYPQFYNNLATILYKEN